MLRPFIWNTTLLHKNHNIPGMTSSTLSGIKLSSYPLHMKREKESISKTLHFLCLKIRKMDQVQMRSPKYFMMLVY